MIGRTRAVTAAFALACTLALPAHAQQTPAPQPHGPSAAPLTTLPANTARPPASRVPRTEAAQPVRAPVVRRAAVQPALDPATPLDETPLRANGESYAQITREAANRGRPALPVGPGLRGPSVLRVQVLLDRALFSPGMIDGSWGKNTGMSVYWFQASAGLPATGIVDSATYARLEQAAGRPDEVVIRRALRPEEVRGPFTPIPGSIYEQANLSCSC